MPRDSDNLNHYDILPSLLGTADHDTSWHEVEAELKAEAALGFHKPLDLLTVTVGSPISLRRAVFRLARYFQREFGYDFPQYGWQGKEEDANHRAYLWLVDASYRPPTIGACCFRWRKWSDAPPGWAMQWIWMHPYERRKGNLAKAWPYFRARFGDFFIEPPVSEAMRSFVAKRGDTHLLPRYAANPPPASASPL